MSYGEDSDNKATQIIFVEKTIGSAKHIKTILCQLLHLDIFQ